jgi:hypothetical protein
MSTVLDIGGRNVNGSNREFFPNLRYTALDIEPAVGVDIVADARTWEPDSEFDLVMSTSVLEHVQGWQELVKTAWKACKPFGFIVITCAGPGWGPHSASDGALKPGEWYEEPEPDELRRVLVDVGFANVEVVYKRKIPDLFAMARKVGT